MSKKQPTATDLIAAINARLDGIEDNMAWLIRADMRFRVGQRVKFSRPAFRRGLAPKTRTKVRGTVTKLDGFIVRVEWDDRKHPETLHHQFIDPLSSK